MAGRPTDYKEEYNYQAYKLCLLGFNQAALSIFFEVSEDILMNWGSTFKEFSLAQKKGIRDSEEYIIKTNAKIEKRKAYKRSLHIRKYNNDYVKNKLNTSPKHRVRNSFSSLLRHRLKTKNKQHTFNIVGYTVEDLMVCLENKFKPGMSWDNYGKVWHIDHKKPDCLFNYTTKEDEDFRLCWSLDNLQPLFALDNMKKGGKYASA